MVQLYQYINAKRIIDSIVSDLIGPSHLSSKGNTYVLACICLLTSYPTAIPIPSKTNEMVAQDCLQHIYATFGGSLTLITDQW